MNTPPLAFQPPLTSRWGPLPWSLLGLALLAVASLALRPAIPVDETRYLAVAWEMWLRGDFLVPYLNGEPYSHKPPLLFWLFHLGWTLFGVNDWWPRLVAPLAGAVSLLLTVRIGELLWPQRRSWLGLAAPWLLGCGYWAALNTAVMFDLLLVAFTLGGVLCLVREWRGLGRRNWVWGALCLGGGALVKGPMIFLILAWPVLLAPWWMEQAPPGGWARWYGAGLLAALAGGLIALAWAIPAAWQGGPEYAQDIFWGQTAGRALESFSHRRPVWWYLPWIPLILLPWTLWTPAWASLKALSLEPGTLLGLTWLLPPLLVLSLVSGKQVAYLLPLVPALALLVARGLSERDPAQPLSRPWAPAGLLLGVGALMAAASASGSLAGNVPGIEQVPSWPGLMVMGAGLALGLLGGGPAGRQTGAIAAGTLVLLLALHLALPPVLESYDVRPMAGYLAKVQAQGRPLAHVGKYRGQYHFAGRLTEPLEVLTTQQLAGWAAGHPEHRVLVYTLDVGPDQRLPAAEFDQDYRVRQVSLWRAGDLLERPDVLSRLR